MCETIAQQINSSPFNHVYWFARQLVNGDKYGALGTKEKYKKLLDIVTLVEALMTNKTLNEEQRFKVSKNTLLERIDNISREGTKVRRQLEAFSDELEEEIQTIDDLAIFCFTAKYVVGAVTKAEEQIPSNDREFAIGQVRAILDEFGETGIGSAIATWDRLGERGCLEAERIAVVETYQKLLYSLSQIGVNHSSFDDGLVTTAFIQEFERRLGQKRTGRAGRSLESVVDFLFDYYSIPSTTAPDHFESNLEFDKWFACGRQGWKIGISCKRTVRERWKNLIGGRADILSTHRVREVWHIMTYDADVTDSKVVELGRERQYIYLRDDSPRYLEFSNEVGTKDFVRPLSNLIQDIQKNRQS